MALANLRPDTDAVAAFTPRYGVLSWYQGQPGIVTARDVVRFRDALRQAWEGNKNVLAQMWVDLRARLRVEPTGLEIVVEDLWTLIRLMFLRDWVERRASLCAACFDGSAPHLIFWPSAKDRSFAVNHAPCESMSALSRASSKAANSKKNQDRRGENMPKQRKRDGTYWRKDRKQWWVSYVDAQGKRMREAAIQKDGSKAAITRKRNPSVRTTGAK